MTVTITNFSKNYDKLKPREYILIAKTFLFKLSIAIIKDSIQVQLPYALGAVFVSMYKSKEPKIDFGHFNKTGKIVRYTNLHTYGNTYKIEWSKKYAMFKNSGLYIFKVVPDKTKRLIGSRGLASWIKTLSEQGIEYIGL